MAEETHRTISLKMVTQISRLIQIESHKLAKKSMSSSEFEVFCKKFARCFEELQREGVEIFSESPIDQLLQLFLSLIIAKGLVKEQYENVAAFLVIVGM